MKGQSANLPDKRSARSELQVEGENTSVPRADVNEGPEGATLVMDMPGVDEKSLDIRVERNVLTVSAKIEGLEYDERALRVREFAGGYYRRIFTLSDELDIDTIEASIRNGVLNISIPKAKRAQSRKIAVRPT